MQQIFYLIILCCAVAICKDLPANLKKCNRNSDKLNECLKDSIQDALEKLSNGLPDFKLQTLEPLEVESMIIGAGTGPVQVVQNFKDVEIFEITKSKINGVKTVITDTHFHLEADTYQEKLLFRANYDLNGKILILPIVGNGKCTIELNKMKTIITFDGDVVDKDGTNYLPIKEITVKLNPELVVFNFTNLFNGDEKLGTQMNKVLNDNQQDVFNDVKSGYEEFLSIVIKDIANRIFTKVPYTTLLPL